MSTTLSPNSLPACVSLNQGSSTVVSAAGNYVSDSDQPQNNTVLGTNALGACTSGTNNTAVGNDTLTTVNSGASNTAVGFQALQTTDALISLCTCVGAAAGSGVSGSQHTLIGAGSTCSSGKVNCTVVGAQQTVNPLSTSQCTKLGNAATTSLVCPLQVYQPTSTTLTTARVPTDGIFVQQEQVVYTWQSAQSKDPARTFTLYNQICVKRPAQQQQVAANPNINVIIDLANFRYYSGLFTFTATHTRVAIDSPNYRAEMRPLLQSVTTVFMLMEGTVGGFSVPKPQSTYNNLDNTYGALQNRARLTFFQYSVVGRQYAASVPAFVLQADVNVGKVYTVVFGYEATFANTGFELSFTPSTNKGFVINQFNA